MEKNYGHENFKTECFWQIWSNLAKFEATIKAGRVKFAKKCDNNKKRCFQLYRGLGAMRSAVKPRFMRGHEWAQILCYKNQGIHWYHCNPTFLWKINFTLVRRLISALIWDISGLWNRSDSQDFREKRIVFSRFLALYILEMLIITFAEVLAHNKLCLLQLQLWKIFVFHISHQLFWLNKASSKTGNNYSHWNVLFLEIT